MGNRPGPTGHDGRVRNRLVVTAGRMALRTRVFTRSSTGSAASRSWAWTSMPFRRSRANVEPTVPPFRGSPARLFGRHAPEHLLSRLDGCRVRLRVYRPTGSVEPLPVLVYCHGGGWVLGSTRGHDPLCTFLARTVEAVVVSVDDRMAPEHHAPKAVHDIVDSVRWLGEHADSSGGDASRLGVSGERADGNLAAIVCQVVRDEGARTT
jgi:acetyl esterase